METPSGKDNLSGFSSSASTPAPPEPFQAIYRVTLTDTVTKDGDVIKYTLKTVPTCGAFEEFTVQRQYEDLEWLEHCLTTSRCISGLIIPPLPKKPAITALMAEAKSRKQLGNWTKTIIGDEFYKDCRVLEQYLNLLLAHSRLGQDPQLKDFLTKPEPPVRAIVRKGLLSRISDKMEIRKSMHKDCEEFFQIERTWTSQYSEHLKEASENFNKMVYSEQRICNAVVQLSTALNLGLGTNDGYNGIIHKLMIRFSEGLEDFKHALEDHSFAIDNSMGISLNLFSRHIKAEEDMLFRRMCLMVDYENSNKVLDKAKGNKRDLAEIAKLEAEKAFEECSDVARQEIKMFHRHRVKSFEEVIGEYAEVQVRTARNGLMIFNKAISALLQFPTPQPPKVNCTCQLPSYNITVFPIINDNLHLNCTQT